MFARGCRLVLLGLLLCSAGMLAPGQPELSAAPTAETIAITADTLGGPNGTVVTARGRGAPPNAALEIGGAYRSTPGGCADPRPEPGGGGYVVHTFARADSGGNFTATFTVGTYVFDDGRTQQTTGRYNTTVGFRAQTRIGVTPGASSNNQCFDITSGRTTFPETGKTVGGRFLEQWEQRGGLAINGFPISEPFTERLENGKEYTVQYFERVRMEAHFDLPPIGGRILLGQFGRQLHPADPPVAAIPGALYFRETGHNVTRSEFIAYWQGNGGLEQFGFPISEEITETLEGQTYRVQYFERARFEWHPENPAGQQVLLGQFGRQVCGDRCR